MINFICSASRHASSFALGRSSEPGILLLAPCVCVLLQQVQQQILTIAAHMGYL
jgi:hypothetical protein